MKNNKTTSILACICFTVISLLMIGNVFERLSSNFDLLDLLTLLQFVGIILIAVAAATDKRKTAAIGAIIAGIGSVGRSFSMLSIYADIAKISVWRTISILHQQGLLGDFLFFDLLAEAAGYFLLAILCGSRKQLRWPGFLSAALFAVAPFLLLSSSGFPYNGTGTVSYLCRIAGAILYTFYSSDKEVASLTTADLLTADIEDNPTIPQTAAQTIEEIEKYRSLLEQGILTEDEFEKKRRDILQL